MFNLTIEDMIRFIFLCPFFSIGYILFAVSSLYKIKKNKKGIKQEKKEIPFIKKLLLIGYAEKCKQYVSFAKGICLIYWIYIATTVICIIFYCIYISTASSGVKEIVTIAAFFRLYIMDTTIIGFSLIMTKHGKNGGVVWRWEE